MSMALRELNWSLKDLGFKITTSWFSLLFLQETLI